MTAQWKVIQPDGTVYAEGTTRTVWGALLQARIGRFFSRRVRRTA